MQYEVEGVIQCWLRAQLSGHVALPAKQQQLGQRRQERRQVAAASSAPLCIPPLRSPTHLPRVLHTSSYVPGHEAPSAAATGPPTHRCAHSSAVGPQPMTRRSDRLRSGPAKPREAEGAAPQRSHETAGFGTQRQCLWLPADLVTIG